MSKTESPQFMDFPLLYACSEPSLPNMIGSGLNLLCLQSHSNRNVVGQGQRSRFLVLTKRSVASGGENGILTIVAGASRSILMVNLLRPAASGKFTCQGPLS